MTYTQQIASDRQCSAAFLTRAFASESTVPDLVQDAIRLANWFNEQDQALRNLAVDRNADEICNWADEIASTPDSQHGWPEDFCAEVAEAWRAVAEAIKAERASAIDWVNEHSDNDVLDRDELETAYAALGFGPAKATDADCDLWSHCCAEVL